MFLSPLSLQSGNHPSYFSENQGLNVVGLAYFPLLLVGLLSFILTVGSWRFWRFTVWVFFAGLSLYHARAIPFFAVVAAPIAALNLLDYAGLRFGATYLEGDRARSWAVSGRVLTLFLTLLLVAATVPGLTHYTKNQVYQVAWRVELDPSLREAALQVAAWRNENKLPANTRWFTTSPEIVHYFAWFCPGEKGFFDQRLAPFDKVAARLRELPQGVAPYARSSPGSEQRSNGCRNVRQVPDRTRGLLRIRHGSGARAALVPGKPELLLAVLQSRLDSLLPPDRCSERSW